MKDTPTVGQTVFSLNIGNAARNQQQVLTPVIVTKVGRKYFYCGEGWQQVKYDLDRWVEAGNYSPNSRIFATEQEWKNDKEIAEHSKYLREVFSAYGPSRLPLETLRSIHSLVDAAATKC